LLSFAQLREQALVGMNAHATSSRARGRLLSFGASGAGLGRKVHDSAGLERHLDVMGAAEALLLPVQVKGGLR
jgi:hypothetical protein